MPLIGLFQFVRSSNSPNPLSGMFVMTRNELLLGLLAAVIDTVVFLFKSAKFSCTLSTIVLSCFEVLLEVIVLFSVCTFSFIGDAFPFL